MIDRAVTECGDIQLLLKRFQEYTDGTGTLSMPECTSRKRMQRTLSENVTVTRVFKWHSKRNAFYCRRVA